MVNAVKLHMPGLSKEPMPSGNYRYRVRPAGDKRRKITLPVGPDHPDFMEHYSAARAGQKIARMPTPAETAIPRSISWLTHLFESAMAEKIRAGLMSQSTLTQRAAFYRRLREMHGDKALSMPKSEVIRIRDGMAQTPGAADNMVKAIRALFAWGQEQGYIPQGAANPADGVGKINRGTGAVPWSVADLENYRAVHPFGSSAHLALSLLMFTACRIGDVWWLGRSNETDIDGIPHLDWQPGKSGSARVTIPIAPPLLRSIRALKVIGPSYILTEHGQRHRSAKAFANRFRKWCLEAGLENRSAHGIRKAAGELMALQGATQYAIMAVHGHTQAKTSEQYTRGVNRRALAADAMQRLSGMEW